MANFTALKTAINNAIKTNGNEEITGAILQAILDAMVETLGDSAINDLENAITTEVTNRENAVGGVADDLAAEALARANKDNQLDGRINQEEYNRQNADAALSQTMSQGFQTLGSQMTALNAAISALNAAYQNGYLYGGIATPSSSPSNNKCFYIALQGGTYTNFGGVGVVEGINIIKNDSGWKVEHIYDQTTLLNEFYLLRQQVIRAISSIDPIVIQGDVTNAPDEEDLTSDAQNLLKFKDRAYSPLNFSGLGMKILRKNIAPLSDSAAFNGFVEGVTAEETLAGTPELIFWDRMNTRFVGIKDGVYYLNWTDSDNYVPVSTSLVYMYNGTPYQWTGSDFIVDETEVPNLVNCLTQDMINEANTIYIIRYDYTLKEDITIPANCVLEFDGGSVSGEHTITGQNTGIEAGLVKIFNTDVTLAGTWNVAEAYPEWVDLDYEKCANVFKSITFTGDYTISKQIEIANIVHIEIKDKASITIADNFIGNHLFYIHSNESIVNRQKNIVISGSGKTWLSNICGFVKTNVTCCVWLKGLLVYDVGGNEPAVFIERGEPIIEGCSFAAKFIAGESEYQNVPQYMIWGLGDALINDVIVVTPHTAIRMEYCSCFNNIHIWWGQNQVPSGHTPVYTKVGLELGISSFCVNNYYADNIQTLFKFFDSEGHSPEETGIVYPSITATNVMLGNWYSNDSFNYTFVYSERLVMPQGSISYNADRTLPRNFVFHDYNGEDVTNIRSNIRFIGTSNYKAALYSPIYEKARVAGEMAVSEYINEIGYSNLKGEYLPIGIDFSYIGASSYYCISFNKTLLKVVDIDIAFFNTNNAKQNEIKLLGYSSNFSYVPIYKNSINPITVKSKTDGNTVFIYLKTGNDGLFVIRNKSNFILSKVETKNNLPDDATDVNSGVIPGFGTNRPALSQYYDRGYMFFDESLSPARPIWWNGTAWVDATGATV